MKYFLIVTVIIIITLTVGSPGNLDYVKDNAASRWQSQGFKIAGYDGYQWGFWGYNSYGGAKVWYILHRIPDNGILYIGSLWRWGKEIHVYNVKALDAIKP